uniref:Uncharacterized protein n=1 Tax=Tanacetum cinerariifolium TaxID=118510 RepID=A0A6L2LIA0_TANCI|nr:hypothetical protein [Tanacetum cinerariifolium]
MDMTIDQQVAMDKTLIPHASRLRSGKRNFRLKLDISSKESILQLVFDVLQVKSGDAASFLGSYQWVVFFSGHQYLPTEVIRDLFLVRVDQERIVNRVPTSSHRVLLLQSRAMQLHKLFQLAYDVHTCRMIPQLVIILEGDMCTFGTRLSTSAEGKQPAKASKAKRTGIIPGVSDVPVEESDKEISWKSSDEKDDDDVDQDDDDQDEVDDDDDQDKGIIDEESFDPIAKTLEKSDDEGNDNENISLNVRREEGQDEEDDEDELYRDVNINMEGRVIQMADVHTTQEFEDTHVTITLVNLDGQQQSSSVSSEFVTSMLNLTPDAGIDSLFETTPQMDVQALTTVAPLTLPALILTPSTIATTSTVPQVLTSPTTALIKVAVQLQSDRLRDGAQAKNEEFLKNLDENIQKIIKEQVETDMIKTRQIQAKNRQNQTKTRSVLG